MTSKESETHDEAYEKNIDNTSWQCKACLFKNMKDFQYDDEALQGFKAEFADYFNSSICINCTRVKDEQSLWGCRLCTYHNSNKNKKCGGCRRITKVILPQLGPSGEFNSLLMKSEAKDENVLPAVRPKREQRAGTMPSSSSSSSRIQGAARKTSDIHTDHTVDDIAWEQRRQDFLGWMANQRKRYDLQVAWFNNQLRLGNRERVSTSSSSLSHSYYLATSLANTTRTNGVIDSISAPYVTTAVSALKGATASSQKKLTGIPTTAPIALNQLDDDPIQRAKWCQNLAAPVSAATYPNTIQKQKTGDVPSATATSFMNAKAPRLHAHQTDIHTAAATVTKNVISSNSVVVSATTTPADIVPLAAAVEPESNSLNRYLAAPVKATGIFVDEVPPSRRQPQQSSRASAGASAATEDANASRLAAPPAIKTEVIRSEDRRDTTAYTHHTSIMTTAGPPVIKTEYGENGKAIATGATMQQRDIASSSKAHHRSGFGAPRDRSRSRSRSRENVIGGHISRSSRESRGRDDRESRQRSREGRWKHDKFGREARSISNERNRSYRDKDGSGKCECGEQEANIYRRVEFDSRSSGGPTVKSYDSSSRYRNKLHGR